MNKNLDIILANKYSEEAVMAGHKYVVDLGQRYNLSEMARPWNMLERHKAFGKLWDEGRLTCPFYPESKMESWSEGVALYLEPLQASAEYADMLHQRHSCRIDSL